METLTKILLVEDEMLISPKISMQLTGPGVSNTLKTIEDKLSDRIFFGTNRSYIINLAHAAEAADGYLVIDHKAVPVSAGLKEQLLQKNLTL